MGFATLFGLFSIIYIAVLFYWWTQKQEKPYIKLLSLIPIIASFLMLIQALLWDDPTLATIALGLGLIGIYMKMD